MPGAWQCRLKVRSKHRTAPTELAQRGEHVMLTRHLKRCKQLTGLSIAESRDALTVPFSRTLQARGSSTFSEGLELLCIS